MNRDKEGPKMRKKEEKSNLNLDGEEIRDIDEMSDSGGDEKWEGEEDLSETDETDDKTSDGNESREKDEDYISDEPQA